jgi:DNA invertase Pin-like site-specific DNA recombinase
MKLGVLTIQSPGHQNQGLSNEARRFLPSRQHARPDHGQSGTRAARRLFLHHRVLVLTLRLGGLGTAARPLGKRGLGDALHHRDFAREPIERSLVELALRVGLLGLGIRAVKVAQSRTTSAIAKIAGRMGCDVVKVYKDHGISGAKGRDKRPAFDALCRAATRREFDVVMAWSVDRLGRSLQDLVAFLSELHALGIDLFLHQQGLDTTTPAGKAMFQMMGVFAEFERAMIQERVRAGLARAKSEGKRLGRPRIAPELEERIRKALATPGRPGVRKIAERFGVDPGTVQRISRPRPFADGAASVVV